MLKIRVHELILYRNFEENIFSEMAYVVNNYTQRLRKHYR